jgi:hypothetical protein
MVGLRLTCAGLGDVTPIDKVVTYKNRSPNGVYIRLC